MVSGTRNSMCYAGIGQMLCLLILVATVRAIPAQTPSPSPAASVPDSTPPPDELFEKCSPSVVQLRISTETKRLLNTGSGVILNPDLLDGKKWWFDLKVFALVSQQVPKASSTPLVILTNYHVVRPARHIEVVFADGKKMEAGLLLGYDEERDLALIGMDEGPPLGGLSIDGALPKIGERVFAIGNPMGLNFTLSDGLVSGIRKEESTTLIQTTAPLSSGSSGGALILPDGKLLGITTSQMRGGQNLNFAIAGSTVLEFLNNPSIGVHDLSLDADPEDIEENIPLLNLSESERADPVDFSKLSCENLLALYARSSNPAEPKEAWELDSLLSDCTSGNRRLRGLYLYLRARNKTSAAWTRFKGPPMSSILTLPDLHQESAAAFKLAYEANPDFAPTKYKLALATLYGRTTSEYPRALLYANDVVAEYPRSIEAYRLRGQLFVELGDTRAALVDFKESLEFDPFDLDSMMGASSAASDLGDYDYAVELLQKYLDEFDGSWLILAEMARVLEAKGDYQEAMGCYAEVARQARKEGELKRAQEAEADARRCVERLEQ